MFRYMTFPSESDRNSNTNLDHPSSNFDDLGDNTFFFCRSTTELHIIIFSSVGSTARQNRHDDSHF